MEAKFLSHSVSVNTPSYGTGESKLKIENTKSISRGDSSNVSVFTMENHLSTHVDCPAHFFTNGTRVATYTADAWFFGKPHVVYVAACENQLIGKDDLGRIPEDCDLVLIKTGFQRYRGHDNYSCANPGLEPGVGDFLRRRHPSLRALGLDLISVSSYSNRELGRITHRTFLDPDGVGSPILIIEDMDLDHDLSGLRAVWALPLRMEGIDSAPCTVVGIFE